MARQDKIDGLPYGVDLCFVNHKLVIEVDEDGHRYYREDVKIAEIYNYINESPVKLAVNWTEKSLKEKFAKELFMSSISKTIKPHHGFH